MKPTRIVVPDGNASGAVDDGGEKNSPTTHPAPLVRPTAITVDPVMPRPTAIGTHAPAQTQPYAAHPSAISGQARKRIPMDGAALIKRYTAKENVIVAAMHIVEAINQDSFAMNDALLWGQPLQIRYQELVSETLALAQSDIVTNANLHIGRLLEIMDNIDLEKVFASGKLARLFGKATEKIDTPEELDRALKELGQLSQLLQDRIDGLLSLREQLEKNSTAIEAMGDPIESSLIAAEIIAEFFQTHSRSDFATRLKERVSSLIVTLGHIRSGSLLRDAQIEQPMNLTVLIQGAVFNLLPTWMTNVSALRMTLHGHNTPNPTEVRESSREQKTIQQKLRTT